MDFEAENWDVGNEASELDKSLFQKNKKNRRINAKKRKEAQRGTMSQDDNDDIKKRKLNGEEKDKIEKPEGSTSSPAVFDSAVVGSLSRKEKRDKKWQEKILRRKQMSGTKSLNVSNTLSEQESKFPVNKSPAKCQPSNMNEDSTQMSRAEKRKVKWQKIQEKKRLRLGQTDSNKQPKAKTEVNKNNKPTQEVKNGGDTSAAGQINRKERKKLQWKQKLKERKLSQKNEKEIDAESESKEKIGKVENDSASKSQKEDKQEVKSKTKKHVKEEKIKSDESNQLHSPKKEDTDEDQDNDTNTVTNSVKKKAKRKRICKRNKFKEYVKPEMEIPKSESDVKISTEMSSPEKVAQSVLKVTQNSEKSATSNNKSVKSKNNKIKMKDNVGKKINEFKQSKSTVGELKKDAAGKVSDKSGVKKNSGQTVMKEGKKNISLDPNVLRNMFSPGKVKAASSNDSVAVTENDKNNKNDDGEEDSGFSRQKKGDIKGKSLLEISRERLNAARFRYLNEQLYTTTGQEAFKMFKNDDIAFSVYHEGFQSQVEKWPTNPIDVIIEKIQAKPKHLILADFGCGDAKLARSVPNQVHSFDLVALNDHVTVCDISKVPLKDKTVDIAVFCLSLMGTNLTSYLKEANRILKNNGTLMIAEVSSRFHSVGSFVLKVEKMGFKIKNQDAANKMFVMMEFKKTAECKDKTVEDIELKPCIYKKR